MFIRKIAYSNLALRKSRAALTIAAVALSVSLVVAVTSGYASLFEAAYSYLVQYMGSTDAQVSRKDDPIGVPAELIDALRHDPAVRHVDERLNGSAYIPIEKIKQDPKEPPPAKQNDSKRIQLVGIDRPGDHRVDQLKLEGGKWFNTSTGYDAVVDQSITDMLGIWIGDSFTFPIAEKNVTFKVVGVAHKPAVVSAYMHTVYVPLKTLEQLMNTGGRVSAGMIELNDNADRKAFQQRWTQKLAAYNPPIRLQLTSEVRTKMDQNLQVVRLLSYLGGAVSMLAATFIIFSALSMGVTERQRSLAMLRAVGAFKSQIAGLVIFEGLLLAAAGLLIGIPLGYIWIKSLSLIFYKIFSAGAVVSWNGVLFGGGGTLITALLASLLPAWNATRVNPLEAMSPLSKPASSAAPLGWALIGALLVGIDPFLFYGRLDVLASWMHIPHAESTVRLWRFYGHFALGLPAMFAGLFLLAPMCVWIIERVGGPLVAKIFALDFSLLRQQLTGGIWRAAGTGSALMVGLAVLLVMQVTGRTMLKGWQLPDKFPDVFIGTTGGLTPAEVNDLAHTPGLTDLMPIEIASVKFGGAGGNPFAIGLSMLAPDSTMFIAVDPAKAFQMMDLDFHIGNREETEQRLKEGGWVVVTEEYRHLTHCKVGDPIELGGHTFHIAASVWSPGIDVMKGMYDLADQFDQRTISSVFGSIADGEKYFGTRPYVFCGSIEKGVPRAEIIKQIKKHVHALGLQVGDVREIKTKIENGAKDLLDLLSTVAFAALAVASLGVTNTIMAAVRTRRWQFGILRSIGVTRGQLLRLVMAEALLLGLVGCVLGIGAGSLMSINANALSGIVTGYHPPITIPWPVVGIGVFSVLFISLAASVWPAMMVARAEPLSLLQAGRAAT
ncbi:MAG TPA: FtsX-like permease family protein [Tepidisphaeraceae bacterium]|jgi:putative ABC transport system permease protein|nr:FtsX-like permease family protein [Tepidisphaeraceae bacterium]